MAIIRRGLENCSDIRDRQFEGGALGLRWSGCGVREQGLRDTALLGLSARHEGISWPRDGSGRAVQVCGLIERLAVNSWGGRKGCGYRPGASGKEALEA